MRKFSETPFKFTLLSDAGFKAKLVKISSSKDNKLGEDFEYELDLILTEHYQIEDLIGQSCIITIGSKITDNNINGLITRAKMKNNRNIFGLNYSLSLTINSVLFRLKNQSCFNIYIDKTPQEIIIEILSANNLENGNDYYLNLEREYTSLPCWVKYTGSDYDNLIRLISYYGIYFYFDKNNGYKVNFIDNKKFLPRIQDNVIKYKDKMDSEDIIEIKKKVNLDTEYFISNKDDLNTSKDNYPIGGYGTNREYGNEYLREVKQQAIDCRRELYFAITTNRSLSCGDCFCLSGHSNMEYNTWYTVISAKPYADYTGAYYGKQSNSSEYRAELILVKSEIDFRIPIINSPIVPGILLAEIDGCNDNKTEASLSTEATYRVKYFYDEGYEGKGKSSPEIHQGQPLVGSGKSTGFHFPNKPGTMIAVGFNNNSINQPVILGAIHEKNNKSPTNGKNSHQNILRSGSGNQLVLDDKIDNTYLSLGTRDAKNQILLDSKKDSHKIHINSEIGDINLNSKQDIINNTDKDFICSVDGQSKLEIEGDATFCSNNKIYISSGGSLELLSGNNIDIESINEDTMIKAEQNIIMGSESCDIINSEENINIQAVQNELSIDAGDDIQITAGNKILFIQSGGSIELTDDKISILTGSNINIVANNDLEFLGQHYRGNSGGKKTSTPKTEIKKIGKIELPENINIKTKL